MQSNKLQSLHQVPVTRRHRFRASERRRGALAVELGFMLPILAMVIIGMMELSRAVMVQQILTNAAREGARRAVVPETSNADVTDMVTNYLQQTSASIAGSTPQIEITDEGGQAINLPDADPHTVVMLRVSVPYQEVGFGTSYFFSKNTMSAAVQMRKE